MAHSHESIDITDIEPIAYEYNGNIAAIAKKLNVSRQTIYQYFKRDPKGKELIDKVRGMNTEYQLDLAELVINKNMMNYETNPSLAQRAAEKIIDKKGYVRGYENKSENNEKVLVEFIDATSKSPSQIPMPSISG